MKNTPQRRYFWQRNTSSAEPTEPAPVSQPEKILTPEEQVRLNVLAISGTADSLVDNIQMHISDWGNQYYHFGQSHGRVGTRDFQMETTAEIHATLITDRMVSTVNGRVKALQVTIAAYAEEMKNCAARLKWSRQEQQAQNELKMNDSRLFSRFNAWFAFGSAILIILADIAVSINLVGYFGVGNNDEGASFWEKLADPELLLFSLGIAFCTIYIKLFYDEYIGGKFAYQQQHFRQLAEDGANLSWLRTEYWVKFAFKFFFLMALLVMLYYLALYRTYFTVAGKDLGPQIDAMVKSGRAPNIDHVILYSFIGITILLPVISGAALSFWSRVLSNRQALIEAAGNSDHAAKELISAEEQFVQQTFILEQLREYFKEWDQRKEKVSLLSAYFNQQYKQGFKIGYHKAHGNDLYQLVELARNEELNELFNPPKK